MRHAKQLLLAWMLGLLILSAGCRDKAASNLLAEPELPLVAYTSWSERSEVFLDGPALVAGARSQLTVHVTLLDTFRPLAAGSVEVRLIATNGETQRFLAEGPSQPGMFGVVVTPDREGEFSLQVQLRNGVFEDTHDLGTISCAATRAEAVGTQSADDPDAISFLKDQQWTLDFATSLIESRPLRHSLRVPGEVLPRSGGEAEVSVPFDGRLVLERIPAIGAYVTQGQTLASLLPPTSAPSDLAMLELAREEAQLALELARKDRERAQRLVESGAAPAKRLDEAQTLEATQDVRLKAARDRLAQYDSSSVAEAEVTGARLFSLRAPIGGILTMVDTAPNSNVKAGDVLFRIVDADTVYVSAIVPEAELSVIRTLSGAQLEIPGGVLKPLTRLIAVGRVVDAQSRTFPVVYQVDNHDRAIAINQTLYVHLLTRLAEPSPVVPELALVDDGGRPFIFIQTAGETFIRRPVRIGIRESGQVQVVEGAAVGERVVTRGAHLIRLATLSTQVPAEGHVH